MLNLLQSLGVCLITSTGESISAEVSGISLAVKEFSISAFTASTELLAPEVLLTSA